MPTLPPHPLSNNVLDSPQPRTAAYLVSIEIISLQLWKRKECVSSQPNLSPVPRSLKRTQARLLENKGDHLDTYTTKWPVCVKLVFYHILIMFCTGFSYYLAMLFNFKFWPLRRADKIFVAISSWVKYFFSKFR